MQSSTTAAAMTAPGGSLHQAHVAEPARRSPDGAGPAFERLRATHVTNNFFVSRPLQETALELLASPAYATHLRRLATALRERRESMTRHLVAHCPQVTVRSAGPGGYHLWVPCRTAWSMTTS